MKTEIKLDWQKVELLTRMGRTNETLKQQVKSLVIMAFRYHDRIEIKEIRLV